MLTWLCVQQSRIQPPMAFAQSRATTPISSRMASQKPRQISRICSTQSQRRIQSRSDWRTTAQSTLFRQDQISSFRRLWWTRMHVLRRGHHRFFSFRPHQQRWRCPPPRNSQRSKTGKWTTCCSYRFVYLQMVTGSRISAWVPGFMCQLQSSQISTRRVPTPTISIGRWAK